MSPGQNHRVEVYGALEGETVADAVRFVSSGVSAPGISYVHADHLGSPQKMTDSAKTLVWDAVYTPFGQVHAITGTATNNQRFPGQYADAETGYSYNYFRDYDPRTGRYIQSDSIGLRGGLNTYSYVQANPLVFTDPEGLIGSRGPYHAPNGVSLRCDKDDTCSQLQGKMDQIQRMINSHQGWDRRNPSPRGGGRHANEIADLWRAYARCQSIYDRKNCSCPEEDQQPGPSSGGDSSNSQFELPDWWWVPLIPILTPWPDPI